MNKFFTLLLMSVLFVAEASANDSIAVNADSLTNVAEMRDSAMVVGFDTLKMSVPAPILEWDNANAKLEKVKPNYLYVPLIYQKYRAKNEKTAGAAPLYNLNVKDAWLVVAMDDNNAVDDMRFDAMVNNPQDVCYNESTLPEPPKSYVISTDPSKRTVTIQERTFDNVPKAQGEKLKVRRWLHSFNGSVQVSQAYLSDNWYQGGENNVNVLGNAVWNVKLNENVYKNLLFENTVQYKVSVNSASQDTIRGYSISQDQFQINTKFGYKAIKKWYYSTNLRFKTQLLNNYESNTNNMTASLLSPAELNIGVGMTYNTVSKDKKWKFDLSLSPLSADMKMCIESKKMKPTSFGIEEGKHFKASFGSNVEAKMTWQICREVTWTTRLFAFTNYDNVQGDWENTLNFSINKYLSSKIYAHLRYDNSVAKHDSWKYWQFNEILSFGFNYTFSMN